MRIMKYVLSCTLTDEEMKVAAEIGRQRNKEDKDLTTTVSYNGKTPEENNIVGAQCEYAFNKMYGLEWEKLKRTGDWSKPDAVFMDVTWDAKGSANMSSLVLYVAVDALKNHPWDFYALVVMEFVKGVPTFYHIGSASYATVAAAPIHNPKHPRPSHKVTYGELIFERMDDTSVKHLLELALPEGGYKVTNLDTGKVIVTPP